MKLPQNTFNKRKIFGCALAVDKPTREKDLLLPLYLRHERRDFSRMLVSHTRFNYILSYVLMHIRPSLLELMMRKQDLGRFHTDFTILSSRR